MCSLPRLIPAEQIQAGATGIIRIRADWAAIIIIAEVIRPIYIRMESVRIRMGLPAVPEAQALPTVMHPAPEVLRLPLRYRKQRLQPVETLGWKQDEKGWWYKDSETTYKKDGVYSIDGNYYAFNAEGYMITGWQEIGEYWYYFDGNGHMLIDVCTVIDGSYCYFDKNGRWDEEYYDSFSDYLDNYDY